MNFKQTTLLNASGNANTVFPIAFLAETSFFRNCIHLLNGDENGRRMNEQDLLRAEAEQLKNAIRVSQIEKRETEFNYTYLACSNTCSDLACQPRRCHLFVDEQDEQRFWQQNIASSISGISSIPLKAKTKG
jgi:hypothetical protein